MKKYVTASLLVLIAIGSGVAIVNWIAPSSSQPITGDTTNQNIKSVAGINLVLSSAELAKHNSSQSCWLLISGKIYDVTSFLPDHPGEAKTILPTCGTDATAAYASRGGTGSHSATATAMLADYYIGDLNQTVNTSSINSALPAPTGSAQSRFRGGDDDWEDD